MKKENSSIISGFEPDSIIINALDQMVEKYNVIPEKAFDEKWNYFWECHSKICKSQKAGKIYYCTGDYALEYLKELIENDGPEYSVTISIGASDVDLYIIGVCVRGMPLFKKIPVSEKA